MSAPEESRDRRRGLAMPKSLRGSGAVVGGFALGMLSISTGVGAVVLTGLVISGWLSIEWLSLAAGLLGTCVVSFAVHRRMNERIALADAFPPGAPLDRLFRITLEARGGWLRRYLEPMVDARLVIADDGIRFWYRRPVNLLFPGLLASQLALNLRHVGIPVHWTVSVSGVGFCFVLLTWTAIRRHDARFPWSEVLSASTGAGRFHVLVGGEDYPEGFLFSVPEPYRKRVAELLAERTLFHAEE